MKKIFRTGFENIKIKDEILSLDEAVAIYNISKDKKDLIFADKIYGKIQLELNKIIDTIEKDKIIFTNKTYIKIEKVKLTEIEFFKHYTNFIPTF